MNFDIKNVQCVYIKFHYYQLKIDCAMFYVSLMTTTKQKPRRDTRKNKKKESKYTLQEITKSQRKTEKEEGGQKKEGEREATKVRKHLTVSEMAIFSAYLSVGALNVNELNSPVKRIVARYGGVYL